MEEAHNGGLQNTKELQGWAKAGAESGPAANQASRSSSAGGISAQGRLRAESTEQFAGADRVLTPFILSSINGAI